MCEFCKELEDQREAVRIIADQHKDEEAEFGRWTIVDESVALVTRTTHIRADGTRVGTTVTSSCYKDKNRGFDLNYCPECGKEIKRWQCLKNLKNHIRSLAMNSPISTQTECITKKMETRFMN